MISIWTLYSVPVFNDIVPLPPGLSCRNMWTLRKESDVSGGNLNRRCPEVSCSTSKQPSQERV